MLFKSEVQAQLATIEGVLRQHTKDLLDRERDRALDGLEIAAHKADSRALFEKIADLFDLVDRSIRLQREKIEALAAFVGARFVNQPAQPEKIVVEPVEPVGDEDDLEFEVVFDDDEDDEEFEHKD